jgi:hypothetical protein
MRVPPGSREWSRRSGLVVRTLSTTRTASRGGPAPPPCFAVERGRRRGIEGLPLLVREAARHSRGVFAVGEEACSDGGLAVYPVAEAVVPPREPCLSGGAGGVEALVVIGRPRGRRFWIWRGRDRPAVAAVASQ